MELTLHLLSANTEVPVHSEQPSQNIINLFSIKLYVLPNPLQPSGLAWLCGCSLEKELSAPRQTGQL